MTNQDQSGVLVKIESNVEAVTAAAAAGGGAGTNSATALTSANTNQQQQQQIAASGGSDNCCTACQMPIKDRFIFNVINQGNFHQGCVRCCDCSITLNERCYTYEGKLYCRLDYWRRFGPKCSACTEPIKPTELVQRLKQDLVYHLSCFVCQDCKRHLQAGEQLHLLDDKRLLCKRDYLNNHQHQLGASSIGSPTAAPATTSSTTSSSSASAQQQRATAASNNNKLAHMTQNGNHQHHQDQQQQQHNHQINQNSQSSNSKRQQQLNNQENNLAQLELSLGGQNSAPPSDDGADSDILMQSTTTAPGRAGVMQQLNSNQQQQQQRRARRRQQQLDQDEPDAEADDRLHLQQDNNTGDQDDQDEFDDDIDEELAGAEELLDEDGDSSMVLDELGGAPLGPGLGGARQRGGASGPGNNTGNNSNFVANSTVVKLDQDCGDDLVDANGKRRGPRTTIKPKQLETLREAFESAPKPSRHIREQLAAKTGLNMRVIQVWFQNRRSKERRMRNSNGSARRNFFRSSSRRLRVGAGVQPVGPGLQLTQLGVSTGPVATMGGPQSLIASSANGSPATTVTGARAASTRSGGPTKENRLANGTGPKGQQQSKGAASKQQQQQQQNLARLSPLDTNNGNNNNNNNGSGNQTGGAKSNSNNSPGDFSGSGGVGGPASSNGGFSYFSDSSNQGGVDSFSNGPSTTQTAGGLGQSPGSAEGGASSQPTLMRLDSPSSGGQQLHYQTGSNSGPPMKGNGPPGPGAAIYQTAPGIQQQQQQMMLGLGHPPGGHSQSPHQHQHPHHMHPQQHHLQHHHMHNPHMNSHAPHGHHHHQPHPQQQQQQQQQQHHSHPNQHHHQHHHNHHQMHHTGLSHHQILQQSGGVGVGGESGPMPGAGLIGAHPQAAVGPPQSVVQW